MESEDDVCGHPTADDTPCQHPTTDDGDADRCWIDAHNDAPTESGDPGRDPKLTRERQERIAQAIESGASIAEASRKNGIHRETFRTWMKRGEEQEEGIYADFFGRLTRARGEGEATYRDALIDIAKETGDTATLMAMLKQRYPDEWAEVDRGEQADTVRLEVSERVKDSWPDAE